MKTSSARFTLNFANQTIVGTKASFDKASKGTGDVYEELVALMEKHPTYGVEIKEQKKKSDKPKNTYEGLTISLIEKYIAVQKNNDALMNTFTAVINMGAENKAKYGYAKRWFCENFKGITVEAMKKEINDYNYNGTIASVENTFAEEQTSAGRSAVISPVADAADAA